MRFTRLEVAWFQGVKSARVDFGPGLNVLYGPNDLGKSTLAMAIRAALLLPTGSSEADAFHPWHAAEKASVTLSLVDATGRHWRVKKTFGGTAGAQLAYSKDGQDWTLDAKGREVDEKLRTLLPWGIPSPGGKGAPRGLPESFLTNALLGAQNEVDAILTAGLNDDAAESGKLVLTSALSALAQDPLFKKVLAAAQTEFDRFFTDKGTRRTGQSTTLVLASEAVKKLQTEKAALAKQLDDALTIEERSGLLRDRRLELTVELEAARARLAETKVSFARGQARQAVAERLVAAEAELAAVDAHARRVDEAVALVASLRQSAEAKAAARDAAEQFRDAAAQALRAAEESVRKAEAEHNPDKAKLARLQLEAKASILAENRRLLEETAEKATAAARAQSSLDQVRAETLKLAGDAKQLAEAHQQQTRELTKAEGDVVLANGIVAYGRWRVASDAAQAAAGARAEAARLATEALSRELAAHQHEVRAQALLEESGRLQAVLPSDAQMQGLKRLSQEKALAEAALGGGLTVAVRPRRAIALHVVADDGAPVDLAAQKTEHVVDAQRRVELSIGDLVDVDIAAGSPESRRAVEVLRRRWKEELVPALEKAAVAGVADLEAGLAAVARNHAASLEERASAKAAKTEAEALRARAAVLEKQPSPSKDELDAKEARIGGLPREVLAQFFSSMGASWEAQCEELRTAKTKAHEGLRAAGAVLQGKQKEADWKLEEAKKREGEAAAVLSLALAALAGEAPAAVHARIAAELSANLTSARELEAQVQALGAAASSAVESARKAVAAAEASLRERSAAVDAAAQGLAGAQAQLHAREGEAQLLQAQLGQLNRADVVLRASAVQHELAAFGAGGASAADLTASENSVARVQAQFDEVNEAFLKADGALTSVAGPLVKERVQQLQDAVLVAQARERELSVDADSWKLLRDALREAEKTESAHLGKALAVPVAARFTALTQGKYAGVTLDQDLRTESVLLNGVQASGDSILAALSVGTRDQLATLVRLAVASQLKTAILLDDQLVHTDVARLGWFADVLRTLAEEAQVLVFTCRPLDYVRPEDLPGKEAVKDLGSVRAVDLARVVESAVTRSGRR